MMGDTDTPHGHATLCMSAGDETQPQLVAGAGAVAVHSLITAFLPARSVSQSHPVLCNITTITTHPVCCTTTHM